MARDVGQAETTRISSLLTFRVPRCCLEGLLVGSFNRSVCTQQSIGVVIHR